MVIWSTLEASCPVCSHRLRLRQVGSGFALGQDSDLLVRMEGKHVIQAEIHSCQRCFFSGYTDAFLRTLSKRTRERFSQVIEALRQESTGTEGPSLRLRRETPLPDVQYLLASRAAEALQLPHREQGLYLLRAYWCARLPPTANLPPGPLKAATKTYLKRAIQKLRQALSHENDPSLVYLVGELCRRNGDFLLAESYFQRFLERKRVVPYLRQAASKLLAVAQERNPSPMTMEEVLYDATSEREEGDRGKRVEG